MSIFVNLLKWNINQICEKKNIKYFSVKSSHEPMCSRFPFWVSIVKSFYIVKWNSPNGIKISDATSKRQWPPLCAAEACILFSSPVAHRNFFFWICQCQNTDMSKWRNNPIMKKERKNTKEFCCIGLLETKLVLKSWNQVVKISFWLTPYGLLKNNMVTLVLLV